MSTPPHPWPKTAEDVAEQLQACPAETVERMMAATVDLRAHPTEVLGRDWELDRIEARLTAVTNSPTADGAESGITAQAIVGPPGAGKTTMLAALKRRLIARDINVIEITAQDLRDPEMFSAQIRQQPPWRNTDRWDLLFKAATADTARVLDEAVEPLAAAGLDHLVKIAKILNDGDVEDMRPVSETLAAWRDGRTPRMEDVMQLLQNVNDRGTVILIDEAQELTTFLGENREHPAASILRMLNDPKQRANQRIWNVTMLLAGMQGTPGAVAGHTNITPGCEELGALPPAEVRAMIANGIDRSGASEGDRNRAKAQWASALAAEYGDWPRHARCAEGAAGIVLEIVGGDAVYQPWGPALIMKKANHERKKLYLEVVDRAKNNGINIELQTAVMLALKDNGQRLSGKDLSRMVRHWLVQDESPNGDRTKRTYSEVEKAAEGKIAGMTRSGIIAKREGMCVSPIPSLMGYIIQRYDAHHAAARQALRSAGLDRTDQDDE